MSGTDRPNFNIYFPHEKALNELIVKQALESIQSSSRLDDFYSILLKFHRCVPNWRFGQFIINFLDWHKVKFGTDFFYLEEVDFLQRLELFINDINQPEDDD